jgi:hypothetical protein
MDTVQPQPRSQCHEVGRSVPLYWVVQLPRAAEHAGLTKGFIYWILIASLGGHPVYVFSTAECLRIEWPTTDRQAQRTRVFRPPLCIFTDFRHSVSRRQNKLWTYGCVTNSTEDGVSQKIAVFERLIHLRASNLKLNTSPPTEAIYEVSPITPLIQVSTSSYPNILPVLNIYQEYEQEHILYQWIMMHLI